MRLSHNRINAIAHKIAFQLVRKRYVITSRNLDQVSAWVERPILEDMAREAEIDQEVRDYIKGLTKKPPEGSFAYQALYQKKKEEVARRRNYTL